MNGLHYTVFEKLCCINTIITSHNDTFKKYEEEIFAVDTEEKVKALKQKLLSYRSNIVAIVEIAQKALGYFDEYIKDATARIDARYAANLLLKESKLNEELGRVKIAKGKLGIGYAF